MANTIFQIKRSIVPGKIPGNSYLQIGELAINLTDARIFSKHTLGDIVTLSDYNLSNSAYINAGNAFIQANTALITAQSAYGQANTATTNAATALSTAQSAYGQANTALSTAQSAYGQANTATTNSGNAFNQANTATTNAATALSTAQSAYGQANTANINAANASFLSTGTVQTARLGSGTANASTYLAGDNSWKPLENFVSTQDIGTDPNQIPLNQYLGDLAYQDASSISGNVTIGGVVSSNSVKTSALYDSSNRLLIIEDANGVIVWG